MTTTTVEIPADRFCKPCARGRCSRWRHWHIRCRYCRRFRIFRGPSCETCHAEARELVADLLTTD